MNLGNVSCLQMLRKCAHPVGVTTRGPRRADTDTHLGCPEDPPSESQGNRAPHTQLQQKHLHSWIRLRDSPTRSEVPSQTPQSNRPTFISPMLTRRLPGPRHHLPPRALCQHLLPSSDLNPQISPDSVWSHRRGYDLLEFTPQS